MRYLFAVAFAAAIACSSAATAQPLPLNTGYNYNGYTLYPQPSGTGPSTVTDNYWIKIASYEPPAASAPVAPAWVLNSALVSPWVTLPNSRWLGPRPLPASSSGTSQANPAYSIYRKCFCLMPGYQNPTLSFQLRADNDSQAWLNGMANVLIPPSPSSFSGAPLNSLPTTPAMFRAGLNCIYVMVEDTGGAVGFNLAGNVSALGLMPVAGAGVNNSFAPCQCGGPVPGTSANATVGASARMAGAEDHAATVRALVAYAEERRRRRTPR
jgi:hypothetical protein